MFQGKIKKSEKLPRGSFLYIRVGDRLYAGEEAVVVADTPTQAYEHPWYTLNREAKGRRRSRNYYWTSGMPRRLLDYYRKKGHELPKYMQKKEPKPVEPKRSVTGTKPRLTDEFKEAKQFRRLNQAQAACDKLNSMYAGLDIKVVIELHEGDA